MISSLANEKVKLVRALQSQRKAREKHRCFVIEGVRLAEEAIRANAKADLVFFVDRLDRRGRAALNGLRQLGAVDEEVSPEVMAECSDTETPPGLLAVMPIRSPIANLSSRSFALVIDRLSDPGNLGTLLRTAVAAGVEAAYLAPGTVDAYNPKVVRSAMGAHFRLSIVQASWSEIKKAVSNTTVYLAAASGGEPYHAVDWARPITLIIGGEAEGASAEAEQLAAKRVTIPMPGSSESLNAAVAGGILLFEAARHRNLIKR